jgi:hypothetical protein
LWGIYGVKTKTRYFFFLKIWLLVMAFHSFAVGIGLIWHPSPLLAQFGFVACREPFFPTQGGVFHIVMAIGYVLAASGSSRFEGLIPFSILVKFVATIFLMGYWLKNPALKIVMLSGLVDGAMAGVLAFLYWGPGRFPVIGESS